MKYTGYKGQVTLVSPSGNEQVEITVPGRKVGYGGLCLGRQYYGGRDFAGIEERQDRRFRKLLSQGWKVLTSKVVVLVGKTPTDDQVREEEKKNTDVVISTTKTGSLSHGGDHASGEVKDSPNAAEHGKRARGCRGGQKERRNNTKGKESKPPAVEVKSCKQVGGGAVYAPQPLKVSSAVVASAKRSATLLARLVGQSHLKTQRGLTVNTEKLLVALETGDNPLPSLETQDERPKLKVLVTPDCSGSCQGWSGLAQAWAVHLSRMPDVDVIYLTNANGDFWGVRDSREWQKLISSVDVVLYLGDSDGRRVCEKYASQGATVVAFDCYSAKVAKPRLKKSLHGKGKLHWVDRVSSDLPVTWDESLNLCLKP